MPDMTTKKPLEGSRIGRALEGMLGFIHRVFPQSCAKPGGKLDARGLSVLWKTLVWAGFTLLCSLARTPLAAYPLGISALAAAPGFLPTLLSYAAAIISTLIIREDNLIMFAAYNAAVLIRIAVERFIVGRSGSGARGGAEQTAAVAGALGGAFTAGVWKCIAGGLLYFDLFGAIFLMLLSPLAAFLFSGVYPEGEDTASHELSGYRAVGLCASCAAAIYSLRGVSISLSGIASGVLTLYIAHSAGALAGMSFGLLASMAYSPGSSPVFALAGLAAGGLRRTAPLLSCAAGVLSGGCAAFMLGGVSGLLELLPLLSCAAAAIYPLKRLGRLREVSLSLRGRVLAQEAGEAHTDARLFRRASELKLRSYEAGLEAAAAAVDELSDVVYTLSDRLRRPGIYDARRVIDRCFERECERCGGFGECWGSGGFDAADSLAKLTEALYERTRVSMDDIPEPLKARCTRLEPLLGAINRESSALIEELIRSDKTEAIAADYAAIAALIRGSISNGGGEFEPDEAISRELSRILLADDGLCADGISAYGRERLTIIAGGVHPERSRLSAAELSEAVARIVGRPVTEPEYIISDDGYMTLTLRSARRYDVVSAVRTAGMAREK